jgi:hypothetical protein
VRRGGLEAAVMRLASLSGVEVTVGLQGPEHVADGETPGTSVLLRGAVHEFGAPDVGIPSRPFLRTSLRLHGKTWAKGLKAAAVTKLRGGDAARTLRITGGVAVGNVQRVIDTFPFEDLKEATIEAKTRQGRKDRPLVDTGQMKQSIRASVDLPGRPPEVVG